MKYYSQKKKKEEIFVEMDIRVYWRIRWRDQQGQEIGGGRRGRFEGQGLRKED